MSDTQATTKKKRKGRTREPARTARGRAMLAHIDSLGLTLIDAAKRAGISFDLLHDAIHSRDPRKLRAGTVAALVRLGMRLDVVAPQLAAAHAGQSTTPNDSQGTAASVA